MKNQFHAIATTLVFSLGCVSPAAARADSLMGRDATLQILTYNNPSAPIFESQTWSAIVSQGIEFGASGHDSEGHEVVPVLVDIGENSVRFSYQMSQFSAGFGVAAFNGYELEFSPCIGFANLSLANVTDIHMTADRVWSEANRLYVNVAALPYQASSQFEVSFDTQDC